MAKEETEDVLDDVPEDQKSVDQKRHEQRAGFADSRQGVPEGDSHNAALQYGSSEDPEALLPDEQRDGGSSAPTHGVISEDPNTRAAVETSSVAEYAAADEFTARAPDDFLSTSEEDSGSSERPAHGEGAAKPTGPHSMDDFGLMGEEPIDRSTGEPEAPAVGRRQPIDLSILDSLEDEKAYAAQMDGQGEEGGDSGTRCPRRRGAQLHIWLRGSR